MRNKTEDDITAEVLERFCATPDPRLRRIVLSLIGHLHAFVKEVELTEAEWFKAIEILTEAGKMCSDRRQEFILFSDTLGVSMVVDLLGHRKPEGSTESTVFGPFHRLGAPEMPAGGNIAHRDTTGTPAVVSGRVVDRDGRPIAGAVLDVWQAQTNGLYNSQDKEPDSSICAASSAPTARAATSCARYPGQLPDPVRWTGRGDAEGDRRHPWRPAHIHFVVSADGYEPVTTHIFDRRDPYLQSDAVFAVKDSLICDFVRHEAGEGNGIAGPYFSAEFDFCLAPAGAAPVDVEDAQRRLAALGAREVRCGRRTVPRGFTDC